MNVLTWHTNRFIILFSVLFLCACGVAPSVVGPASVPDAPGDRIEKAPEVTVLPSTPALATRTNDCLMHMRSQHATIRQAADGIRYDEARNTIMLTGGTVTTLAAVRAALDNADLITEQQPGEWYLSANIEIYTGASLTIAGSEVGWLKLRSDSQAFVSVKALGGKLSIVDTCISSWDESRHGVDEELSDGRSFVLVRDGGSMEIRRSYLHHLGYDANESYGVAIRMPGTQAEIVESELAYNFYGLYSHEASGLIIRGNEVHHSHRYGIDPHTSSNNLLIEGNISHDNGKHGIILAEGCSNSIIRNNTVYNNMLHGIVLYNGSNNNRIEGNTVYGNHQQGINLNNVMNTEIVQNTVYENGADGIGIGQNSQHATISGNIVRQNMQNGIYIYTDATDTTIDTNQVIGNQRYGIYLKSSGNRIAGGNRVRDNAVGIVAREGDVSELVRAENEIGGNGEADVRLLGE